ncbi:biotin-dependent carboxyltransferase family protein [Nonlabens mediterrranea]|uniref:Biotin-dependent carboxyltransferase family protein n=1 Tax=Nonlabens mediterrranea TaxID=1419947 RepID=A0ABS0A7Z7_9FLAO|nr:biotin-dependent carboxyltransferase family protein [Nonlabens mediterrranea]
MGSLSILTAGFRSTIQDLGRLDYRDYGVPHSGVMDQYSSRLANRLLNNTVDCAVIEMTLSGAEMVFSTPTQIAITGAPCKIVVQQMTYESPCVIKVETGDVVKIGTAINGNFIYMSIAGGFMTDAYLGSRSYYPGILDHALIKKDDQIFYNNVNNTIKPITKSMSKVHSSLKAFIGPEFHKLTRSQQIQLLGTSFSISKTWNRMAIQLNEKLINDLEPIHSSPVLPGTIQLTPHGKLVVLMRDAQTTGGYPRVLQLTEEAINKISQYRVDESVNFIIKN